MFTESARSSCETAKRANTFVIPGVVPARKYRYSCRFSCLIVFLRGEQSLGYVVVVVDIDIVGARIDRRL